MKLEPLNDKVVLKSIEAESVTQGGIILPDSAKQKPLRGKIIAVGPGKKNATLSNGREEMVVKVGDEVVYGMYAASKIEIENETFVIVSEENILAICR